MSLQTEAASPHAPCSAMSLQRRLLLSLLVCAPLVWAIAMTVSVNRARHEVNELYDSELIRLAREVQATLLMATGDGETAQPPKSSAKGSKAGDGTADLDDLAIAVWDAHGTRVLNDREGAQLSYLKDAVGFVDQSVDGRVWRVYYLQSSDGSRLVAAGQRVREREEVVAGLTVSQLVPWLLMMPVLLAVMAWAVRRSLGPLHALTSELKSRAADNLAPLAQGRPQPAELAPLVGAVNGLFFRVTDLLARERRFVADAAHELRTPLATLRAQWDVVRRAGSAQERAHAEARLDAGMERMDRLVTQLLALSRAETANPALLKARIDWPDAVEQAMNDCLALAQRRHIELACEWPKDGQDAMPLVGDQHLMVVVLRNLLDNAARYSPEGSAVTLRMGASQLSVDNAGEPLSAEQVEGLGRRFHRAAGQQETGSGLGVSIVQRIAELHGLRLAFGSGEGGRGVRATLSPAQQA
jgi:two-component system, OmpR family, sensor histidine kinase QseC